MSAINKQFEALRAELERLGLNTDTMPGGGLALGAGTIEPFLLRLKGMSPGVTWRDVFPDLPAHWEDGKPETWT